MLRRSIARVFFKATGWRVVGDPPAPTDARIFVGAPHTAGWDSVLMLAVAWRYDLRIRFLIKAEVVKGPAGWFWRSVGAIPVQRDNPGPLVADLIERARSGEGFQLVLTPEGTRKPVKYWKSGFYRLGMASGIPVILVSPDGPTKIVTFGPSFRLTGDVVADMDRMRAFFADQHGVDPSKRTEARLRAEDDPEANEALLASVAADIEALDEPDTTI